MWRTVGHRGSPVAIAVAAVMLSAAAPGGAGGGARVAPHMYPDHRISDVGAIEMEWQPAVAWNGTDYLVVWMDERNHSSRLRDIFGRRVSADGSPIGSDFLISGPAAVANDEDPAVAWNGSEYLVVWSDQRTVSRDADIYGRRVSAAGVTQGSDFLISGTGATAADQDPDLAWNGSEYLVVWSDQRTPSRGADIYGRRVSAAGSPQGSDRRICGSGASSNDWTPAVAWSGTDYLVVWSDSRDSASRGSDVYGRFASAAGSPQGSDLRISGSGAVLWDQRPDVEWGDGAAQFLVVWQDNRNYQDRMQDIYGRVVLADGSRPKADFRISGIKATHDDESPAVVWNGSEYLVVWEDYRKASDRGADIYGRVVLPDGARPDPDFRVSSNPAFESDWAPAVTWNGTARQYLVVWQDFRELGTRGADIYGRRIEG